MIDFDSLLRKCQRNDRKAQQVLYDLFKNKMMGICLRYSISTAEADDIFQDAFVKVFKKINQLKDSKSLQYWIRRIVINTAINHYHQQKKYLFSESYNEAPEQFVESASVLNEMDTQQLMDMIRKLPEGYRLVFNLYVVDGFNHKEIGAMLDISENTSKSQLRKAKIHLQNQLKKMGIRQEIYNNKI